MVCMDATREAGPLAWTPRRLPRRWWLGLLIGYLALSVWATVHGTGVDAGRQDVEYERTDAGLYRAITDRMIDGQGYYQAVAIEQPARGYPTSPVVTVREPTVAWATALVGEDAMVGVMWGLVAAALVLSVWVYERTERRRGGWVALVLSAAAAVGIFAFPGGVYVHEVWMSLLVYLALLARGVGWVRTSVVMLLLASVVRELVAPVMLVMLVVAWRRGERRESATWAAALALFALFYGLHALRVDQLVAATGPESDGWLALGGWPFVIDSLREPSILTVLPFWLVVLVAPFGVLGWVMRSGPFFDRVTAVLVSYVVLFCFVGRPDNAYWGTFLAVFVVPGIAMAVVDGGQAIRGRKTAVPEGS
jgi:hypothetical protein